MEPPVREDAEADERTRWFAKASLKYAVANFAMLLFLTALLVVTVRFDRINQFVLVIAAVVSLYLLRSHYRTIHPLLRDWNRIIEGDRRLGIPHHSRYFLALEFAAVAVCLFACCYALANAAGLMGKGF